VKHSLACTDFKPYRKNTLVGFAQIYIAELRLTIRDVAIHEKGTSRWAQLPAKPMLKDGSPVFKDGKAQYSTILEFDSREVRDAFSRAAIVAILAAAPRAFQEDATSNYGETP
jgi:hypothetical protein